MFIGRHDQTKAKRISLCNGKREYVTTITVKAQNNEIYMNMNLGNYCNIRSRTTQVLFNIDYWLNRKHAKNIQKQYQCINNR